MPSSSTRRPPTDGAVRLDGRQSLTVQLYFARASRTNLFKTSERNTHFRELGFGFFGEVGGLLSALKKQKRDQLILADVDVVAEELGDALWYLVNMAALSGLPIEELARSALAFVRDYVGEPPKRSVAEISFRTFDSLTARHRTYLAKQGEKPLQMLARDSGAAIARGLRMVLADKPSERAEVFGRLLGQLALVSARHHLNLETIALENLAKIADRWPEENAAHRELPIFGEAYEQFPSDLEVVFIQRRVNNRTLVVQQIKGLNIGDPLTDNSNRADGYRFHDAFHLAYAVHLGWSPVIRALLKLKRKSDSRVDENEDGARAIIIEEGIATWIFNHSKRQSPKHYAAMTERRLDYALLKQVRGLATGYEVANVPLWQWERAILDGFKIFRLLLQHKGGMVRADLANKTLDFTPPDQIPQP